MKLYLVRHGETDSNLGKIHQHLDIPLNQTGISQAKAVAERFAKIPVDVILSSPNLRAKQTAEVTAQKIGKQIIYTPLLSERKRPSEIMGKPMDDPQVVKVKGIIKDHMGDPGWHYSDEENFFEAKKRLKQFLTYLEELRYENVLAVSHTVAIRMIVSLIIVGDELSPEIFLRTYETLRMENAGITLCQKENTGWALVTWNDRAHLG